MDGGMGGEPGRGELVGHGRGDLEQVGQAGLRRRPLFQLLAVFVDLAAQSEQVIRGALCLAFGRLGPWRDRLPSGFQVLDVVQLLGSFIKFLRQNLDLFLRAFMLVVLGIVGNAGVAFLLLPSGRVDNAISIRL